MATLLDTRYFVIQRLWHVYTLQHTYDPYAFLRDAYLQRRQYLVTDGKVAEKPLIDPGADAPDSSTKRDPDAPSGTPSSDPPR